MYINTLTIKGFKRFTTFTLDLHKGLNVLVGDNESGKSTLLEALHLALTGQLSGRNAQYEIHPYLFNCRIVEEFFCAIKKGLNPPPPEIIIEVYIDGENDAQFARLKGSNNSKRMDCSGLSLRIHVRDEQIEHFQEHVRSNETPEIVPDDYYSVTWLAFSGAVMTNRGNPCKSHIIDAALALKGFGPDKYISQIINEALTSNERITLSNSYRRMKDQFSREPGIGDINKHLDQKKGQITNKQLSLSMDMSTRSTWELAVAAHLDLIPFDLAGKGEKSRVKIKLAIESAATESILLVEEPENHLSHSNMSLLIEEIRLKSTTRQLVLTTHSSYVLNKLGIDSVIFLSATKTTMKLPDLSAKTRDYFKKLPGYDTLRLILCKKIILVEGPSDELIVQKAYLQTYNRLPIQDQIDVLAVGSLAFKRFLEIATKLELNVAVVTDNDKNVEKLKKKYSEYIGETQGRIRICFSDDETLYTLELHLLKCNSRDALNGIFEKSFDHDEDLLEYMRLHKTAVALKIFDSSQALLYPQFILDAISE